MDTLSNQDLDYVNDARAAVRGQRINGANFLIAAIIGSVAIFVAWAAFAEIDEITKGEGKVIPSSSLQTIQNLEGGIMAELLVKEGQQVNKGDILARIDDTQSATSVEENTAQRDALEASCARYLAESKYLDKLEFSTRILEERKDLVASESRLFKQRREELERKSEVLQKSLDLASEELRLITPVVLQRAAPKVDMLRLEREVNELRGELADLRNDYQNRALEAHQEARAKWESISKVVEGRADKLNRTVVKSPVNGTINEIHIKTVGGVIQPGQPIMDIVPADESLLVLAKIRPSDIAFLRPGNKAKIKFTAYDFSIYGSLDGEVVQISADTIQDEIDKEHYYQIKVRNSGGKLEKNGETLPIIPGMVAQVDVLTGRRTILQYLTKPFHRTVLNALSER